MVVCLAPSVLAPWCMFGIFEGAIKYCGVVRLWLSKLKAKCFQGG